MKLKGKLLTGLLVGSASMTLLLSGCYANRNPGTAGNGTSTIVGGAAGEILGNITNGNVTNGNNGNAGGNNTNLYTGDNAGGNTGGNADGNIGGGNAGGNVGGNTTNATVTGATQIQR